MISESAISTELVNELYKKDKKRLDNATLLKNSEITQWDKINRAVSSRPPINTSSLVYNQNSWSSGYNTSNETGTINTAISMAAANLTSFLLPEKEDSISLRTIRDNSGHQVYLDKLQTYLSKIFFESYTHIYTEMNAACYEAITYGNGAILVNFEQDSDLPRFSAINTRNLSILRDPLTNEIIFIGAEYYIEEEGAKSNSTKYVNIWEKQGKDKIVQRRWKNQQLIDQSETKTWPVSYGSLNREPGRVYGNGLVLGVLKEVQRLNTLIKGNIEAIERQQNPIKVYNPNSFQNPELVKKTPNGGWLAIHNMAMGGIQPVQMDLNIAPALQLEQELQKAIRDGLYIDTFLLPEQPYMTASEVLARLDQKIQILVPMVEGLQYDIVHQLVLHVAERVLKMNVLPNRPEDFTLDFVRLSIESRFDKLKNLTTQSNIMTFSNNIGLMAQLNPSVIDNFNYDEMSSALHRHSYLPTDFKRSTYEVEKIREERARSMAADKAMALQAQTGNSMAG